MKPSRSNISEEKKKKVLNLTSQLCAVCGAPSAVTKRRSMLRRSMEVYFFLELGKVMNEVFWSFKPKQWTLYSISRWFFFSFLNSSRLGLHKLTHFPTVVNCASRALCRKSFTTCVSRRLCLTRSRERLGNFPSICMMQFMLSICWACISYNF